MVCSLRLYVMMAKNIVFPKSLCYSTEKIFFCGFIWLKKRGEIWQKSLEKVLHLMMYFWFRIIPILFRMRWT